MHSNPAVNEMPDPKRTADMKMAIHDKHEAQIKTSKAKLDTLRARAETTKVNIAGRGDS